MINEFADYSAAVLGRAKRTCQEYTKEVRLFARYMLATYADLEMSDEELLLVASRSDVNNHIIECAEAGCAESTRARKISALRSFYNYLLESGLVTVNPLSGMPRPRYHRALPAFLSLADSKRLIQSVRSREDLFYRRRNACIIILFLNCGLRLSELAGIQTGDLYDDAIRILGKGSKERYAYLNRSCQRAVRLWLSKRGALPGPLFTSKQGKGVKASSIASVVKGELREAGLDMSRISTHKLRHTAATLMYRQGKVDIRLLQAILGHASIATTEIYTHIVDEQVIQAMEAHPLSDF